VRALYLIIIIIIIIIVTIFSMADIPPPSPTVSSPLISPVQSRSHSPRTWASIASPQTTATTKSPPAGRLISFALACLFMFLMGFETIGFQALLPVLEKSGVYHSLCHSSANAEEDSLTPCNAQMYDLHLMFTLTITALNITCFFTGIALRRFGEVRVSRAGAIVKLGAVLMFAFSTSAFPLWLLAYPLMAVGGCFATFGALSLPYTLGVKHTQKYFAMLMAASDGSAIIYYGYQLLYQHAGVSLKTIFLAYAVVPVVYFFVCPWIYPKDCAPSSSPVKANNNDNNNSSIASVRSKKHYHSMMNTTNATGISSPLAELNAFELTLDYVS